MSSKLRAIDFFVKSTVVAIAITSIPIIGIILITEFGLVKPLTMILWMLLTLAWTVYVLTNLSDRIIASIGLQDDLMQQIHVDKAFIMENMKSTRWITSTRMRLASSQRRKRLAVERRLAGWRDRVSK